MTLACPHEPTDRDDRLCYSERRIEQQANPKGART